MHLIINILDSEIEDWNDVVDEVQPIEKFIENDLNKHEPVRLYQSIWNNFLENLRENFHCQSPKSHKWQLELYYLAKMVFNKMPDK